MKTLEEQLQELGADELRERLLEYESELSKTRNILLKCFKILNEEPPNQQTHLHPQKPTPATTAPPSNTAYTPQKM